MHPRIFAIIPVHNGVEHTVPTVRALSSLLHPRDRIVVVDDGSTDGTAQILRREHPEVTILPGDGNLWWSGAVNQGVEYALQEGADYVLLLNNDVCLHPQFLEELLLGAAEHPNALIASKILSAEEPWIVWSMGGRFDFRRGRLDMMACGQFDDGRWEEPLFEDWLPGMSVLVPVDLFRRGVWVDAHAFPQYSGDSDLTLRARQAGFDLVVWPRSRVYNKVKSSGLTSKLLLGLEPLSMKRLVESLTSIRSSAAFNTLGKLVLRHSPFYTWPITLGRFYGFYFLKCLQVWLKLPRLRRRALPQGRVKSISVPRLALAPEDKPELISLDL